LHRFYQKRDEEITIMPKDTLVTLSPGAQNERQIKVDDIEIPDLWHVAGFLEEKGQKRAAAGVLEVWHLAHDLKKHILKP